MMKRIALLLLPLLLFCGKAAAQTLPYRSGKILTWDDFQVSDSTEAVTSELGLYWHMTNRQVPAGRYNVKFSQYTVEPRKDLSLVQASYMTPQELSNQQSILEMAESCANAISDSILFSSAKPDAVFQYFYQQFKAARDAFLETGEASFLYPAGKSWDPARVDWQRPAKGLLLEAGLAESILLGPASELIAPSTDLVVSVGGYFGNSVIMVDGTYGFSPNLLKTGYYQGQLKKGKVPHFAIGVRYGYLLPRINENLQIYPYVGAGFSGRGLKNMYEEKNVDIRGVTATEGIALDYYFQPTVNLRGSRHHYSELGLQLKVYSDQLWYAEQKILIPTVNVGLGISLINVKVPRNP